MAECQQCIQYSLSVHNPTVGPRVHSSSPQECSYSGPVVRGHQLNDNYFATLKDNTAVVLLLQRDVSHFITSPQRQPTTCKQCYCFSMWHPCVLHSVFYVSNEKLHSWAERQEGAVEPGGVLSKDSPSVSRQELDERIDTTLLCLYCKYIHVRQ